MRRSRRLRRCIVSERRARIRVLVVAVHGSRSISGPTAAPASSRDCIIRLFPCPSTPNISTGPVCLAGCSEFGCCAVGHEFSSWPRSGSALSFVAYSAAYLYLEGNWWLPLPIYIEHALFALFWTAAIAGYWGGLEALAARVRGWMHAADNAGPEASRWRLHGLSLSPRGAAAATAIMAVLATSVVPAVPIARALKYPKEMSKYWFEAWPNEPELRQFFRNNIGLRTDPRFRGSVFFYTFQYDEFLTLNSLWVDGVPTTNEYSQLVTPQAIYFIQQLFKRNLSTDLNWFRPWINTGDVLLRTLVSHVSRTWRALCRRL